MDSPPIFISSSRWIQLSPSTSISPSRWIRLSPSTSISPLRWIRLSSSTNISPSRWIRLSPMGFTMACESMESLKYGANTLYTSIAINGQNVQTGTDIGCSKKGTVHQPCMEIYGSTMGRHSWSLDAARVSTEEI